MNNLLPTSTINDELRKEASTEVVKEQAIRRRKLSPYQFIEEVGRKFIEKQIDSFPMICDVTRMQNKIKQDELRQFGRKGKYTDSLGWSESHEFKFEYEIPSELHLFMINLVYKDFWGEDNRPVWTKFMKKILSGQDSMEILMWVKSIYGSNTQNKAVVG